MKGCKLSGNIVKREGVEPSFLLNINLCYQE
nr:MAG TPA: hypothetical protein [Caudoviricetes sp.]